MQWTAPVLDEAATGKIARVIRQANAGEPLQYLAGYQWFWKSRFSVEPGVLIPRPETETLVDLITRFLPESALNVAELGAGSGNIGVSCLLDRPRLNWHAWEISPEALRVAEKNAGEILMDKSHYHLHFGDFCTGQEALGPWDAVVSNPPYVSTDEMERLSPQVRREPSLALDGGYDGLTVIHQFVQSASRSLVPRGLLAFEIGEDQACAVSLMVSQCGFTSPEITRDLAGRDRVLAARKAD